MEFRSLAKLPGKRLLGRSTYLTPQLEDYDVIRNTGTPPELVFQDVTKKKPFKLVLNIGGLRSDEYQLYFTDKNILEVKVKHEPHKIQDRVHFIRNCVYKFELPDGVNKDILVALCTSDGYLVIVESTELEDLQEEEEDSEADVEESSVDEESVSIKKEMEVVDEQDNLIKVKTEPVEEEGAEADGKHSTGEKSDSTEEMDVADEQDPPIKVKTELGEEKESEAPAAKECSVDEKHATEISSKAGNSEFLYPKKVKKVLKPCMDPFVLRHMMGYIELRLFYLKRLIENGSFRLPNLIDVETKVFNYLSLAEKEQKYQSVEPVDPVLDKPVLDKPLQVETKLE